MQNIDMETNDNHALTVLKAYVVGQARLGYTRFSTDVVERCSRRRCRRR